MALISAAYEKSDSVPKNLTILLCVHIVDALLALRYILVAHSHFLCELCLYY